MMRATEASGHLVSSLLPDSPTDLPAVEITIDGALATACAGERLIDAINRTGKEVPQVCYHHHLGPIQTCDTCMVEVNGKLVRACGTTAQDGMTIATESARAQAAQHEAFDRILGNHLLYCTVCDNNNGNCTVHNTTALLKVEHQKHPYKPKPYEKDFSNPFYRYDPDQCILCGRCVEACQNVQVNETLSIRWEDEHPRVLWDGGEQIGGSSCVSCGHCITVCPCNALMEKSMLGEAGYFTHLPADALNGMIDLVKAVEPEIGYGPILQLSETEAGMRQVRVKKTKTVCTYCGVGCSFDIWTKDRNILKVEPGEGAANNISTCVKGKFGWDFVNHKDRLQKPLIREGESFREASWDEALDLIEKRFKEIKAAHGPDSLGFISSSKCTNEENYLMQKLARAVVGTNNVDNCSRYCQSPATQGLFRTVGYGGDSGSISDIGKASLVLIIGSNTAESHPVLATRVKRAHKLHGQKLIVADLREHEMARRADIHLRPTPSTDLVWLSAITRYIIDSGKAKMDFIEQWVNKLDEYKKSLEPFTLEFAEQITGISRETLIHVADEIAAAPSVCALWAMGVTQHCGGSDTSTAISNLLLATGNYMRPGTGAYPLRGHNNVQGASDFGCMPIYYPGYEKVEDEEVRKRYEQAWGVTLPTSKGLDNHEMVDAIFDGKMKGIYLFGEDMYSADSNANRVGEGFSMLDFFVVQDIFFTETCRYADVVLPASPSLEKDGTFVNTERRIQRLYEAFPPLGESKPDWEIVQLIANRLGAHWKYTHPADVMHEAASLAPMFAGVTYDRLAGYKTLQWPVAVDGTDEPLLYTKNFKFPDGKANFYPLEWLPPCDQENDEFDLHLNNGRLLEHFHEGNMTYRVAGVKEETPNRFVEVSPELAETRSVVTGQWVDITSKHGEIRTRVLVTDRVKGNQLYMPLNSPESPVNLLTGSYTDRQTHTPAYKETPVKMKALPWRGENPLPRINFRYGKPTPQRGVEVERKWKRADYSMPGNELVQIQTKGAK
ncbi:formate dehydrogenase subunit alpha [Acidobacterium sp. S8]|uniref:formate dehydrogenase subunit alpha n=1 Tax=Acidobacterium sp. S8 TaxID=1641854 RepID=UPI0020B117E7|nr:formate dehydrogenase subunit alpha [Acidobacterium sp. S8]